MPIQLWKAKEAAVGSGFNDRVLLKPQRLQWVSFFLTFFSGFYLFIHERHRERHKQREKQAPCRKPDVDLNPRTLGSQPEPKADAQPLSHPGVPGFRFQMIGFFSSLYLGAPRLSP